MRAAVETMHYTTGEVTDAASFEALAPEWKDLLERTGAVNPFRTFEWQWSWWKTLGAGRELLMVTVRDHAGALTALAPMMISRRHGLRILELVGSGLSDYPGFIAADGANGALAAIFRCLAAHRRRWDVMDLRILDEGHVVPNIHALAAQYGFTVRHRVYEIAPFLRISGTWADFLKARSEKFRYDLRRREKRFKARVGTTIREPQGAELGQKLVEELWAVERNSWKTKVGTTPMRSQATREFYAQFLPQFSRRGWLQVKLAYLDGAPIAYIINFLLGGRSHQYAISYREDASQLAPGMLLLQTSVQEAFEAKRSEYDFLCGSETYKDRWATGRREVLQIVISKPTVRSSAAAAIAYRLRWVLARSPRLRALKVRLAGATIRAQARGDDRQG